MADRERAPDHGEEDRALLERLAALDPAAFAQLYDSHAPLAFGAALRMLGAPAAAERAVEEVFLALWRQGPGTDPTRFTVRICLLTRVCQYARARS